MVPPPAHCNVIASTVDLSKCPANDQTCTPIPNWLSPDQETLHTHYTEVTPQACYAPGDAHTHSNNFANEVAWVRGPERVGRPSPDDSYVGAVISSADLKSIAS